MLYYCSGLRVIIEIPDWNIDEKEREEVHRAIWAIDDEQHGAVNG